MYNIHNILYKIYYIFDIELHTMMYEYPIIQFKFQIKYKNKLSIISTYKLFLMKTYKL